MGWIIEIRRFYPTNTPGWWEECQDNWRRFTEVWNDPHASWEARLDAFTWNVNPAGVTGRNTLLKRAQQWWGASDFVHGERTWQNAGALASLILEASGVG